MAVDTTTSDGARRQDIEINQQQQLSETYTMLPQVLDMIQATPLRTLLAELVVGTPLVLDASEVERMSTPCAQVLLATGRAATSAGLPFRIRNASGAFQTAIADLGLQADFTNWMD